MPKIGHLSKTLILRLFFIIETNFSFANHERPSLDIGLVFDHSYSMFEYKDSRMHQAQTAAINFIDHLDPAYDRVALIRFSGYREINKYLGTPFNKVYKENM